MNNILFIILASILIGILGGYNPMKKVDYEVMGHQFWRCYFERVKDREMRGNERRDVVEMCEK